jgi:hypothetical protein
MLVEPKNTYFVLSILQFHTDGIFKHKQSNVLINIVFSL